MMARLWLWLLVTLEGGGEMLAMFMATQIIKYPERYKFSDMPFTMKSQIATILIDNGAEHLIDDSAHLPQSEG